ncbi:hypothetical protein [Streptomyces tropicalis]|uniref:Uncharacterized protein n=1 Tax=Streptomyces tropicalis TaxID=3034234 RepID=A0ABT6A1D5_9ACTN|nr:hypothetical protein [Streptomyces tropicalis]MDF3298455.1 hypothetical protein [Streptomyces tropicalis]
MNGDWLLRGRDGRLGAYLPSGGFDLCRAERWPGGPWDGPHRVGGDQRRHTGPAVGQGADRHAHLVSWRPSLGEEAGLVHCAHHRPRPAAPDWHPVGHPDGGGGRTGTPAVVVDGTGRAHVLVRNRGGGMSLLAQQEQGGRGSWTDLKGREVHPEPAAVTAESGCVELYAAVPGGLLFRQQREPGGPLALREAVEVPVRPGTLRALATSAAGPTLFYTDEADDLYARRPGGRPVRLLPAAGPGPVAAVRCTLDGHDCTPLAQRSSGGRVAFAAHPTQDETAGAWWTESGPVLPADAAVALAADEDGRVAAATASPATGRLRPTRRKHEPGLALEAWREV